MRISALVPVYDQFGVWDYARVDEEDYERVNVGRWSVRTDGYAAKGMRQDDGTWVWVSMHRFVMGMRKGDGLHVDHINHDKLDNRRANLQILTPAQHVQRKRPNGTAIAEASARLDRRKAREARAIKRAEEWAA